ncbi:MAG: AraC family transcriptional regulator [Cyanobacteria bacterium P01_F01_bin.116]
MAIELTDVEFIALMAKAQQQGELVYQPMELGAQVNLPKCLGEGGDRIFELRHGLHLEIRKATLKQPLRHLRQHETSFPFTSKFYLAGMSRIQTLDASDIECDYHETVGHHYLYHLPGHTEIEEWPAHQLIHLITISADTQYLSAYRGTQSALPLPLQKLLEGDCTQRFYQSLGEMTSHMWQLVRQILDCPHDSLMQQIYLESKVLELLAAQLAVWVDQRPTTAAMWLCPEDMGRLHQARDILTQRMTAPPSLSELARLVGLNERKLKQGFRQQFGTTVFGYLREYRMNQAKELLHKPNLTIAGIATQVGYKSPEAFSNAFRRRFSVNPKTYQLSRRF